MIVNIFQNNRNFQFYIIPKFHKIFLTEIMHIIHIIFNRFDYDLVANKYKMESRLSKRKDYLLKII